MKEFLLISQIVLGVILTLLILLQNKGVGFGRVWGASSASFARRGLEKVVFRLTFVITFLFFALAILQIII